jgi:hypothetical protein
MTKRQRPTKLAARVLSVSVDKVRELTEQIARLEADALRMGEYCARQDTALEGLMRAVLQEACDPYAHPTSIACASLIAAVATASQVLHGRERH